MKEGKKKRQEIFRYTATDVKMKSTQNLLQCGQRLKQKHLLFCHEGILDKLLNACEISLFLPLSQTENFLPIHVMPLKEGSWQADAQQEKC